LAHASPAAAAAPLLLALAVLVAGGPLHAQEEPTLEELQAQLAWAKGSQRIDILNKLARQVVANDPLSSVEYAEEALEIATRSEDDSARARSLNNIGIGYYYMADYARALGSYEESLRISESIEDEEGIAHALNNMGIIHYVRGDYDRSLSHYDRALEIAKRLGNTGSVARGYNNLGNVYYASGRHEEALRYYRDSLAVYEQLGLEDLIVSSLNNIGLVFFKLERFDEALESFERALPIARSIDHKSFAALSLNNIGMVQEARGRLADALASYESSLAVREQIGDRQGAAISLNNVGLIHSKMGDNDRGLRYLEQALEVAQRIGVPEIERDVHLGLSEIHSLREEYEQALESYKRYKAVNDQLFDAEAARQMTELESRYAIEGKDREIALLLKEQQFNKLVRNVILGGVLALIVVVVLLYNRYRLKDAANREMRRAGEAMQIAQREREKAMRAELAHMSRVSIMGELSSALAHELNQPLTAILGNAQATRRMAASDQVPQAEVDEALGDIASDARRASEIIARMRRLIKQGDVRFETLDLSEVLREVEVIARADVRSKQLRLELDLAAELPRVRGDRVQLQQVLLNLVHNAAEAMSAPEGGGERISVSVSAREEKEILLSVRDAGPPVSREAVERMFEPFFTTKQDGLGMGLPICRTIVEAHHGRLWAEPNRDGGLTVNVSLPASGTGAPAAMHSR
jgi:signal transduction histidine kinase